MPCGCGLCSTSFSGGHPVDGLPPASIAYRTRRADRRAQLLIGLDA